MAADSPLARRFMPEGETIQVMVSLRDGSAEECRATLASVESGDSNERGVEFAYQVEDTQPISSTRAPLRIEFAGRMYKVRRWEQSFYAAGSGIPGLIRAYCGMGAEIAPQDASA